MLSKSLRIGVISFFHSISNDQPQGLFETFPTLVHKSVPNLWEGDPGIQLFARQWKRAKESIYPIGPMYGILTYVWLIFVVNVGKYAIDGSYGYLDLLETDAWKKIHTYSETNGGEKWWFTTVKSKTSLKKIIQSIFKVYKAQVRIPFQIGLPRLLTWLHTHCFSKNTSGLWE